MGGSIRACSACSASGSGRVAGGARGAFTVLETSIVIALIVILSALILVAVGGAVRTARQQADAAFARSLAFGVESFKQQFGFLPPLVDDFAASGPIEADMSDSKGLRKFVRVKGDPTTQKPGVPTDVVDQAKFLRYEVVDPYGAGFASKSSLRFSDFSLSFYLAGSEGAELDGVEGPGFTKPLADGSFTRSGQKFDPMIDLSVLTERLVPLQGGYRGLIDRQRNAIRFHRWAPTFHVDTTQGAIAPKCFFAGAAANDDKLAGQVRSFNAPGIFGDVTNNLQLRSATWAVALRGLDGLFGDEEIATLRQRVGAPASMSDDAVRAKAAADNIVIMEGGS